jgi:hypothetical protein
MERTLPGSLVEHNEHNNSSWHLAVSGLGGTRLLGISFALVVLVVACLFFLLAVWLLRETCFAVRDLLRKKVRKQGAKASKTGYGMKKPFCDTLKRGLINIQSGPAVSSVARCLDLTLSTCLSRFANVFWCSVKAPQIVTYQRDWTTPKGLAVCDLIN